MNNTYPRRLSIRADATSEIGGGHVMRCLALAQGWRQRGGEVSFYGYIESDAIQRHIKSSGFSFIPVPKRSSGAAPFAREQPESKWIVLDGYSFTPGDGKILSEIGYQTLLIDDQAQLNSYPFDVVLNHNVHAKPGMYPNGLLSLIGPRYALIRDEFFDWRNKSSSSNKGRTKILVTMGTSDPSGTTFQILKALEQTNLALEIVVVVGPANRQYAELAEACTNHPSPARLLDNPPNLAEEMWKTDLAITSASVTSLELACLGIPMLVITTTENQAGVAKCIEWAEAGVDCGELDAELGARVSQQILRLIHKPETLKKISIAGRRLVDGRGAARVIEHMIPTEITVRPAEKEDCTLIWQWANDPISRANSFDNSEILWKNHCEWFRANLLKNKCNLLICMNQYGTPVGVVRIEFINSEHVISINLSPHFRGLGLGAKLIKAGCTYFRRNSSMPITAYIKPGNIASRKVFAAAGFTEREILNYAKSQALRMVYQGK